MESARETISGVFRKLPELSRDNEYQGNETSIKEILGNQEILGKEKIEALREFMRETLFNGDDVFKAPEKNFEYRASQNSLSDSQVIPESISKNVLLNSGFFHALDYFFKSRFPTSDFDKDYAVNRAVEIIDNYEQVWSFFEENSGLTNYHEQARSILDTCEQHILGRALYETTAEDEYRRAGRKLNALYDLHQMGVKDDDIKDIFGLVYQGPTHSESNSDERRELAQEVFSNAKLSNESKVKFFKLLLNNTQLFYDAKQQIDRAFNQVRLEDLHKDIVRELEYRKVDPKLVLTENIDVRDETAQARPPAYRGETLVGTNPVANFMTWITLLDNRYAALYSAEECTKEKGHEHMSYKAPPQAFKTLDHDAQCLYIKPKLDYSRRHIAFDVDKKQNIWLRRTSERFNVDVFREVNGKLVKVPIYDDQYLKLKKGDVFYIGDIEFELSKPGTITMRKLKQGFSSFENLANEKDKINAEDIYKKGAPIHQLLTGINKYTEEGHFKDFKSISTKKFSEDLADNKKKIFRACAGMLGVKDFIDLSLFIYGTAAKERA